jgi:hypothetical protein
MNFFSPIGEHEEREEHAEEEEEEEEEEEREKKDDERERSSRCCCCCYRGYGEFKKARTDDPRDVGRDRCCIIARGYFLFTRVCSYFLCIFVHKNRSKKTIITFLLESTLIIINSLFSSLYHRSIDRQSKEERTSYKYDVV